MLRRDVLAKHRDNMRDQTVHSFVAVVATALDTDDAHSEKVHVLVDELKNARRNAKLFNADAEL